MIKRIIPNLKILLPNKRINFFILAILSFGIISGSIFITIINNIDKNSVIEHIKSFFISINENNINNGLALKNSLLMNYSYLLLMWILGLSIIGLIINIFLVYLKGFITGFSISAIIITYGLKGIIPVSLYIFPFTLLNMFCIYLLGSYTFLMTKYMLNIIIYKNITVANPFRKYITILGICSIIMLIASIFETFLFPALLKVIAKLYI